MKNNMDLTPDQQNDLALYDRVHQMARTIFVERMTTYGNSWREMSATSIADHIRMKQFRTASMGITNPKVLDEALDTQNYAIMQYMKVQEELAAKQ